MIRIEPIAPVHAAAFQRLLQDPAIAATTPFPWPYPRGEAARYVAESIALREAGTKFVFAVVDAAGAVLGSVLLRDVDLPRGRGELGFWIGTPYWGKGLATAAGSQALAFAFNELGLRLAEAVCLETNTASLAVLARLGFRESGRMAQSLPKWPEPRPSIELRLTRAEWEAGIIARGKP
jgi:RimJ/RimL family protein N-acetyltransferase